MLSLIGSRNCVDSTVIWLWAGWWRNCILGKGTRFFSLNMQTGSGTQYKYGGDFFSRVKLITYFI